MPDRVAEIMQTAHEANEIVVIAIEVFRKFWRQYTYYTRVE
jgi:hypothetical protein